MNFGHRPAVRRLPTRAPNRAERCGTQCAHGRSAIVVSDLGRLRFAKTRSFLSVSQIVAPQSQATVRRPVLHPGLQRGHRPQPRQTGSCGPADGPPWGSAPNPPEGQLSRSTRRVAVLNDHVRTLDGFDPEGKAGEISVSMERVAHDRSSASTKRLVSLGKQRLRRATRGPLGWGHIGDTIVGKFRAISVFSETCQVWPKMAF